MANEGEKNKCDAGKDTHKLNWHSDGRWVSFFAQTTISFSCNHPYAQKIWEWVVCVIWKTFNQTYKRTPKPWICYSWSNANILILFSSYFIQPQWYHLHLVTHACREGEKNQFRFCLKKIEKLFGKYLPVQLNGWLALCLKLFVQ